MLEWIVGALVIIGGIGAGIFSFSKKDPVYSSLKHCKVPPEWKQIVYDGWAKASNTFQMNGLTAKTKCEDIKIEAGIKVNPKTGQWGRPTNLNGKEYWYAGLSGPKSIKVVATPEKKPYARSVAIMTHEIAETMLYQNPSWANKSIDERNKFLWGLGL